MLKILIWSWKWFNFASFILLTLKFLLGLMYSILRTIGIDNWYETLRQIVSNTSTKANYQVLWQARNLHL